VDETRNKLYPVFEKEKRAKKGAFLNVKKSITEILSIIFIDIFHRHFHIIFKPETKNLKATVDATICPPNSTGQKYTVL